MRITLLAHALRGSGGLVVARNFISALAQAKPEHQYLIIYPPDVDMRMLLAEKENNA